MQGKLGFNFTRIDESLLTELGRLTARGSSGLVSWAAVA
jgi:hypothetical protein